MNYLGQFFKGILLNRRQNHSIKYVHVMNGRNGLVCIVS